MKNLTYQSMFARQTAELPRGWFPYRGDALVWHLTQQHTC
jgi:hypothetical protein